MFLDIFTVLQIDFISILPSSKSYSHQNIDWVFKNEQTKLGRINIFIEFSPVIWKNSICLYLVKT